MSARWSKNLVANNVGYGITKPYYTDETGIHPELLMDPPYAFKSHPLRDKKVTKRRGRKKTIKGGAIPEILSALSGPALEAIKSLADKLGESVFSLLSDPKRLISLLSSFAPKVVDIVAKIFGKEKEKEIEIEKPVNIETPTISTQQSAIRKYMGYLKENNPQKYKQIRMAMERKKIEKEIGDIEVDTKEPMEVETETKISKRARRAAKKSARKKQQRIQNESYF